MREGLTVDCWLDLSVTIPPEAFPDPCLETQWPAWSLEHVVSPPPLLALLLKDLSFASTVLNIDYFYSEFSSLFCEQFPPNAPASS